MATTPATKNALDIRIQGKDYRVSCPPEEQAALQAAVRLLDARMEEVADKTRSSGEKLAVMVALNLADELLRATANGGASNGAQSPADLVDAPTLRRRITVIEAKLDKTLKEKKQEDLF